MDYKPFIWKIIFVGVLIMAVTALKVYSINSGSFYTNATDLISKKAGKSSKALKKDEDGSYILMYDGGELSSKRVLDNMEKVLSFAKKDYNHIDISKIDPDSEKAKQFSYDKKARLIVLIIPNSERIPNISGLLSYVKSGGKVIFAQKIDKIVEDLAPAFSEVKIKYFKETLLLNELTFKSEILLKSKGKTFKNDSLESNMAKVQLDKNSKVHVHSKNNPIIWETPYGNGKLIFLNSSLLVSKSSRGVALGLFSLAENEFIYPVLNSKVFFIDDFPSPFSEGYDSKIKAHYNRNIKEFFRDIWWPDMVKSSKLYNIKYTGYFIESYNDVVNPPFRVDNPSIKSILKEFTIELLKTDGELGLHGYNHQPLDLKGIKTSALGYKPWEKEKNIVKALSEALGLIKEVFPKYKVKAYVPPSNIITEPGINALKSSMKDLEVISSVYVVEGTSPAYAQEFSVMPDGIVEFPRISAGYTDDSTTIWDNINSLSSLGIVSHFVHVDDMLDSERSQGNTWPKMQEDYYDFLEYLKDNFNWLEPMTASEAATALKNYQLFNFHSKMEKNTLKCYMDQVPKEQTFILKSAQSVKSNKNCSVIAYSEGTYLVTSDKKNFSITFSE